MFEQELQLLEKDDDEMTLQDGIKLYNTILDKVEESVNLPSHLRDNLIHIITMGFSVANNLFSVACIGLYNQGKSSLLNNLVDDRDNNTFKVSDAKQTVENQQVEYDGIMFIDTPGLSADPHDDATAFEAMKKADVYLFVHKASSGGLDATERAVLEHIAKSWPEGNFLKRTVFVLTNLDKCRQGAGIDAVKQEVATQIKSIFGSDDADIHALSTTEYLKGIKEGKKLLCEHSAVPAFKNHLQELVRRSLANLKKDRAARMHTLIDQSITDCDEVIAKCQTELEPLNRHLEERSNAFHARTSYYSQKLFDYKSK